MVSIKFDNIIFLSTNYVDNRVFNSKITDALPANVRAKQITNYFA
jgi:hypothetical protein